MMEGDASPKAAKMQALKGLITEMYHLMCAGKGDQEMGDGAIADAAAAGSEETTEEPDTEASEAVDMADSGEYDDSTDSYPGKPNGPADAGDDFKDNIKNFMKFGGKPKPSAPGTRVMIKLAGAPAAAKPEKKVKKQRGARF